MKQRLWGKERREVSMSYPDKVVGITPQPETFVQTLETLLKKRNEEAQQRKSGEKWRWADLDKIYPSLKDTRRSEPKRRSLPPRGIVLKLATRLNASLEETNELLIAAEYAILDPFLQGEKLERAMIVAQSIITYLPLPSCAFNRDFNIYRWNKYFPRLFGLTEQNFRETSDEERNILRYTFDDTTPVYRLLGNNYEVWRYVATLGIFWFKSDNMHSQRTEWYNKKSESLMKYPMFKELWDTVNIDYKPPKDIADKRDFPQHILEIAPVEGPKLRIRGIQLKYLDKEYPRILSYIPVPGDEATIRAFTLLGIPNPENWWGYNPTPPKL